MGFDFCSSARSFMACSHSFVMVLGGGGAAPTCQAENTHAGGRERERDVPVARIA